MKKVGLRLGWIFGVTCIRIEILICVCIKRNNITLRLLEYSWDIYFDEHWYMGLSGHFYSGMGLAIRDI